MTLTRRLTRPATTRVEHLVRRVGSQQISPRFTFGDLPLLYLLTIMPEVDILHGFETRTLRVISQWETKYNSPFTGKTVL